MKRLWQGVGALVLAALVWIVLVSAGTAEAQAP